MLPPVIIEHQYILTKNDVYFNLSQCEYFTINKELSDLYYVCLYQKNNPYIVEKKFQSKKDALEFIKRFVIVREL